MPQQITTQQRITLTLSNSESQREGVLTSSNSDRMIHIDAPYTCGFTPHIAGIMSILVTEMDAGSVTQYKIHIPEFDTMKCVLPGLGSSALIKNQ